MIISEMSTPIQHSNMYLESLSEGDIPSEEPSFSSPVFDVTLGRRFLSLSELAIHGLLVTPAEPTVTAGTSQRGRVRTMSRRMAESIAKCLHPVARESTMGETVEDLFHDAHLELQERMRNPMHSTLK
jgi:hypothetical protein